MYPLLTKLGDENRYNYTMFVLLTACANFKSAASKYQRLITNWWKLVKWIQSGSPVIINPVPLHFRRPKVLYKVTAASILQNNILNCDDDVYFSYIT